MQILFTAILIWLSNFQILNWGTFKKWVSKSSQRGFPPTLPPVSISDILYNIPNVVHKYNVCEAFVNNPNELWPRGDVAMTTERG